LLSDPQSEAVQTALWGTDWYLLSPAFKRLVTMMLMRAGSAVKLRNGIFNDLCFATFAAVRLLG
jgi:7tm Odorant receptor.